MSSKSEAQGIFHGPYPAAPTQYVAAKLAQREALQIVDDRNTGDVVADIQSQWQYEQHKQAAVAAVQDGRYDPDHLTWVLDKVLRPLSRDFRDPGDWR